MFTQGVRFGLDGIAIREIARRVGIDRNTVRKYLSRLKTEESISEGGLAEQAYDNDLLELEAERLRQITVHLANAEKELSKTGVTRQLLWQEYLIRMRFLVNRRR